MKHFLLDTMRTLFLTIFIYFALPVEGFSQCLDPEDQKTLDALIALEIGGSSQALTSYFFEHDLSLVPTSNGHERISFLDTFANLDSVNYEFTYQNKALVNYGISKRGLTSVQVDSLYACCSSIIKRQFGKAIENVADAPSEDGHEGSLMTYIAWKVDGGLFGISKNLMYDGFSFSIGHQAALDQPIRIEVEVMKPIKKPKEYVVPKGLIHDKDSEIIGPEGDFSKKRTSLNIPVYDQRDSLVGQVDMIYRHGGNYGPEISYYFIQQGDSIRIGGSELFYHRSTSLLYYGRSDGRLSVLQNTRNEKLFIHLRDLPEGFSLLSQIEYTIAQESWMYHDYSNVGLFIEPIRYE